MLMGNGQQGGRAAPVPFQYAAGEKPTLHDPPPPPGLPVLWSPTSARAVPLFSYTANEKIPQALPPKISPEKFRKRAYAH